MFKLRCQYYNCTDHALDLPCVRLLLILEDCTLENTFETKIENPGNYIALLKIWSVVTI